MTEKLREALHETAGHGRTATVPNTLWADAQRARRRDRVVLPLLAVILIAGTGAVLGLLTDPRHEAAPADGRNLSVPSRIWGMTDSSENGGFGYQGLPPVAEDFQVGPAAALLTTLEGVWAVVSAGDGSYRRLPDLPRGSGAGDEMPVLTSQGDRIAWSRDSAVGGTLRISVANLSTGAVRRFPVPEALVPSHTRNLTWSASGRYLAFRTSEQGNVFRLYVLDTRSGKVSSGAPWGSTVVPLAATDDGGVTITWQGALRTWTPGHGVRVGSSSDLSSSMAISPDGSLVAVSEFRTDDVQSQQSIWFLNPDSDEDSGFGRGEFDARAGVRILGWTPDRQIVLNVSDPDSPHAELTLMDVETAKSKVVGTIDTHDIEQVQIATALMTSDHPTVDRDEPPWVDPDFPWWRAFGISLVLGILLLAVVNVRRRRMAG